MKSIRKYVVMIVLVSMIVLVNGCKKKDEPTAPAPTKPEPTATQVPVYASKIAGGGDHSLVLKQDDSVWATGWNDGGQLGTGDNDSRKDWTQTMR